MFNRILKKHNKKHYNPETKMWRDNYKRLHSLLLSQNKSLYEVAHEKDRLLQLITLAIRLQLDKENEKE